MYSGIWYTCLRTWMCRCFVWISIVERLLAVLHKKKQKTNDIIRVSQLTYPVLSTVSEPRVLMCSEFSSLSMHYRYRSRWGCALLFSMYSTRGRDNSLAGPDERRKFSDSARKGPGAGNRDSMLHA